MASRRLVSAIGLGLGLGVHQHIVKVVAMENQEEHLTVVEAKNGDTRVSDLTNG